MYLLNKEGPMSEGQRNPLANVYVDSSPKYSTVTQSAESKHGGYSLEDDPRSGCQPGND